MKFSKPLKQGIFLKRYKRFFADIQVDGQVLTAHVANTGSMKACGGPGRPCRYSISDNPERKLKYSLEMIQAESGAWVGVNTHHPNELVKESLQKKLLPHWHKIKTIHPEVKINPQTRLDFSVEYSNVPLQHFIEVKNVSLVENNVAYFPDAVTERGQKHLRELMELLEKGHSCEIVFVIQRKDALSFSAAQHIDPEYAKLLKEAVQKGLKVTPLIADLNEHGIELIKTCPHVL